MCPQGGTKNKVRHTPTGSSKRSLREIIATATISSIITDPCEVYGKYYIIELKK